MGMKQAEKAAATAKTGLFISLKDDNDEATFWAPFVGMEDSDDPFVREVIWDDKEETTVDFTAEHKKDGKEPQSTFKYSVIEKTGPDSYARKILELKIGGFQQLQEMKAKYGTYDKFYTIKRRGKAGSKKTKYMIMYDSEPNDTAKKFRDEFAKKRFDLKNQGNEDGHSSRSNGNGSATTNGSGDAVLSDEQVNKLLPKLKELSADKRTEFLSKFGVERVRQVKASDFEAVEKFIADALAPKGKSEAGTEDAFK